MTFSNMRVAQALRRTIVLPAASKFVFPLRGNEARYHLKLAQPGKVQFISDIADSLLQYHQRLLLCYELQVGLAT